MQMAENWLEMVEKQLLILQHLFFLIIEGFYFHICVQSRQKEKELLRSIKIFLCLQKSNFYVSFHLNQILEGFLPQIEYTVLRCQFFDYKMLKVVKIGSCPNLRLPKLKIAKIASIQNCKLPKIKYTTIVSCQNSKLIGC